MATLEKIRSKAGLLIFVIAFALLCFIVGDFLTNSTSFFHRNANIISEVNGVELTNQEFEESYQEISETAKNLPNQQGYDDAILRQATLTEFKNRVLLETEADADGLTVTKAELTDATLGDNPSSILYSTGFFTNQQGMFDKSAVARFVQQVNMDPASIKDENQRAQFVTAQDSYRKIWFYLEKTIKNSLLSEKINNLVAKSLTAPKAEADYLATLATNEFDALVAKKLYADVPDASVKVSDADMKAYYDKFKNYKFKSNDYCKLKLIDFAIAPSPTDARNAQIKADSLRAKLEKTNTNEELQLLFESSSEDNFPFTDVYRKADKVDPDFAAFAKSASKGQVSEVMLNAQQGIVKMAKAVANPTSRPDSIKVAYIVVQGKDSVAAQGRADSIVNALKAGADFAELANKLSLDKRGAQANWLQEGTIGLKDFDDKAFTSKRGDIFSFVQNQGAFVFKVDSLTAPVLKAKIAVLANRLVASTATVDSLTKLAQSYVDANTTAQKFVENAPKMNYNVYPIDNLEKGNPQPIPVQNARCITKWAWEEGRKEGDVSEVITEVPDHIIICAVTDIVNTEDGVAPFDKVKDDIQKTLLVDKKAEMLTAQMKGKQLAQIGTIDTMKAIRFFDRGFEPALTGAVTAAKLNVLSNPVKGIQGVYMFQKIAERPASYNAFNVEQFNRMFSSTVYQTLMQSLENKAKIEDNSISFF